MGKRRTCPGVVIFAAAFAALTLCGCGRDSRPAPGSGKPRVVATTVPVMALALDVLGDSSAIELVMLVPSGSGCPHDYQITPADMEKLSGARAVLANGAGLESFLLAGPVKKLNLRTVELSEGLKLIPLAAEADAGEPDHGHDHDRDEAFNGHTFASPRNAAAMVGRIAALFAEIDPAGADAYRRNSAEASKQLDALADDFAATVKALPNRKIVTIHNVFDYLARDAGLEVIGVIEQEPGQSPTPGALVKLTKKVRAEKPAAIFWEPQYSPKPAETLGRETGVPVFELDPFASGTPARGEYLRTMRANLEALKKALGGGGK
ncbi:MAG TPA: metal ABC transporter substrate-binding protein [Planctomycetota bacterium]|nr:metal ABC transporter substrate-binding protein [Planctomycetota bacterium]